MCNASAAVVANQLEPPETKLAHKPDLIASHGPLGIDKSGSVGTGLAGLAVATQVRQNDRVILGQPGGNVAPREMVLRIATTVAAPTP